MQRPCGAGSHGTLEKSERKILWLDWREQKQGVGDASGEVSRARDICFVKILAFSSRAMGSH